MNYLIITKKFSIYLYIYLISTLIILEDPEKISSGNSKQELLNDEDIPTYLDGPYGAPAEHFKKYEDLIFVAAGVGVTPFSSILISLLYKMRKEKKFKFKSISFYWIQREYGKVDYLNNILEEISKEDKNKLFEINIFITSAQQKYDFR